MKKLYEVPTMEIVRLDASEDIAKLPIGADSNAGSSFDESTSRVTTTFRSTGLVAAILGLTGSGQE